MKVYKYNELGKANYGWLQTSYHFSFSNYFNPSRMHLGSLRVINDDYIDKRSGFDTHPHQDMEIVTYIVDGELTHMDSMKNKRTIGSRNVQYMSAGTGVYHSEFNESDEMLHLYQIWIEPNQKGLKPNYGDKDFNELIKNNQLTLIVSGEDKEDAIKVNQDVTIEVGLFDKHQDVLIDTLGYKYTYLVLINGELEVDQFVVTNGDSIENTESYNIHINKDAHFLLFRVNVIKEGEKHDNTRN